MVSVVSFITTYFNCIFILNAIDTEGDRDKTESVIMKKHMPNSQMLVQGQKNSINTVNVLLIIKPAYICSKLTMETPEQCVKSGQSWESYQKDVTDVFIVNFEQILHITLVYSLLALNK